MAQSVQRINKIEINKSTQILLSVYIKIKGKIKFNNLFNIPKYIMKN